MRQWAALLCPLKRVDLTSGRLSLTRQAMTRPKLRQKQKAKGKRLRLEAARSSQGTNEEILAIDVGIIRAKLFGASPSPEDENAKPSVHESLLPAKFSEIEVEISELSSTGDGLGRGDEASDTVYSVPFCLPGDRIKAKVISHVTDHGYSIADFLQVVRPSAQRNDNLVQCKYFSRCGGCQFQMLQYAEQLEHKKSIVEKAYRNFSGLVPEAIPQVRDTIGSPKQYGYRTKLTPHFDGPPKSVQKRARKTGETVFQSLPPIGFMQKGTRRTMDIEDCPIGTEAVREGLSAERKRLANEISMYRKGATLLLRESTKRIGDSSDVSAQADGQTNGTKGTPGDVKVCITDSNAKATEYIDNFRFENTAGAFFQNNNSILPIFTEYIRSQLRPKSTDESPQLKYLIDAYCGSGLFTVTLSSLFESSIGIDVAHDSVSAAKRNAALNNVKNASFMAADAAALFEKVTFTAEETAMVIDPPRKGCDEAFLNQLLAFGPKKVIYVSCNVHTQARDVGFLVEGKGTNAVRYEIESLQGFDFFPQTGHVEGVAVLNRIGKASESHATETGLDSSEDKTTR